MNVTVYTVYLGNYAEAAAGICKKTENKSYFNRSISPQILTDIWHTLFWSTDKVVTDETSKVF